MSLKIIPKPVVRNEVEDGFEKRTLEFKCPLFLRKVKLKYETLALSTRRRNSV